MGRDFSLLKEGFSWTLNSSGFLLLWDFTGRTASFGVSEVPSLRAHQPTTSWPGAPLAYGYLFSRPPPPAFPAGPLWDTPAKSSSMACPTHSHPSMPSQFPLPACSFCAANGLSVAPLNTLPPAKCTPPTTVAMPCACSPSSWPSSFQYPISAYNSAPLATSSTYSPTA